MKMPKCSYAHKSAPAAQIPGCNADLSRCKRYYQRYKLCAEHLNQPCLLLNGVPSRFCQK
jgi:hypothetical protein